MIFNNNWLKLVTLLDLIKHIDIFIRSFSDYANYLYNEIFFLNKDWDPSWEGNLELWKTDRSQCGASIAPIFNRLVVFNSFKYAYHGVPKILCPEDKKRVSIAMYYYTFEDQENLPEEEVKNIATFYQTY